MFIGERLTNNAIEICKKLNFGNFGPQSKRSHLIKSRHTNRRDALSTILPQQLHFQESLFTWHSNLKAN